MIKETIIMNLFIVQIFLDIRLAFVAANFVFKLSKPLLCLLYSPLS